MPKRFVAYGFLVCILAGSAFAGHFEDAVSAYERGEYGVAYFKWRLLAEEGDETSQYNIAQMLYSGKGVTQDYVEAAKWFRRASDQGNEEAQSVLGIMYADGKGVPQDYVEAHKWFNLAASRYPASEVEGRARAVRNREKVARMMTPQQVAEAHTTRHVRARWPTRPRSPADGRRLGQAAL